VQPSQGSLPHPLLCTSGQNPSHPKLRLGGVGALWVPNGALMPPGPGPPAKWWVCALALLVGGGWGCHWHCLARKNAKIRVRGANANNQSDVQNLAIFGLFRVLVRPQVPGPQAHLNLNLFPF